MPNTRIQNMTPNVRIRNEFPNIRVPSFQTGRAGEIVTIITAGMPIGLLLALTYAENFRVEAPFGDFRPNTRILNT